VKLKAKGTVVTLFRLQPKRYYRNDVKIFLNIHEIQDSFIVERALAFYITSEFSQTPCYFISPLSMPSVR
jgi:hypothetical protein